MSTEQKREFHWFWAWDDEKEEIWLREMANAGWHLDHADIPGWYTFNKGEPRDDVYRLDFAPQKTAEYFQLFQDAGWQYVGEMNRWQYFRKRVVNGSVPEIFTDNDSKIMKYRRILLILVAFLPLFIFNLINLSRISGNGWIDTLQFVFFIIYLIYFYSLIRLIMRISALKKL